MIQDPAGLLERIPELQALCEDAAVRRAVEGGDPFKVYRALVWARWLGRLRSHRETLDALLSRRRLFARPLKGSPWLGTMNSIGASLVGSAEADAQDGTHVATHAVVALFAVPLLPLGAYLVRPAEGSNLAQRSWNIFARVPLSPLSWLYSRAVAVGVVGLVGLGAMSAIHATRYQNVHVVNGLREPLVVTLGGKTEAVPPGAVRAIEVPVGAQKGRASTAAGVEVDTVELAVRSDVDVLAWNVAGAAVLFRAEVVYHKEGSDKRDEERLDEVFCGRRVVELEDADDVFKRPPETVSMSSSQTEVRRVWVDLAADVEDHTRACQSYLLERNRGAEALPFLEALARMSGWSEDATARAVQATLSASPKEAMRVAREALVAHPQNVTFHRIYQRAGQEAGESEQLRAEYQKAAEAAPDSPTAQYLAARLLEGPEAGAAMERLAARFPADPVILRSAIYWRWLAGDWKATAEGFAQLRQLDAEAAQELLEPAAVSLVALGRRPEALALLEELFASGSEARRPRVAELYARVSRLEEGSTPEALMVKLEEGRGPEEKLWLNRARAGLPTEGAPKLRAVQLMQTIGKDPVAALRLAPLVTQLEALALTPASWALAYGEAVRTGAEKPERALAGVPFVDAHDREAFRRFVRGEAVALETLGLEPEVRAAACVVRARNAALPSAERQALLERAKRDDLLRGPVSEAVASWAP